MNDPNCLFCKIVLKEIPADEIFRDEHVVAFKDVNPQAPVHVLIVPTHHHPHLSAFAEKAEVPELARMLTESAASSGPTATAWSSTRAATAARPCIISTRTSSRAAR